MTDTRGSEIEEQRAQKHEASPAIEHGEQRAHKEQDEPELDAHAFRVLHDRHAADRVNRPVRAASIEKVQRTYGNHATHRFAQRMVDSQAAANVEQRGERMAVQRMTAGPHRLLQDAGGNWLPPSGPHRLLEDADDNWLPPSGGGGLSGLPDFGLSGIAEQLGQAAAGPFGRAIGLGGGGGDGGGPSWLPQADASPGGPFGPYMAGGPSFGGPEASDAPPTGGLLDPLQPEFDWRQGLGGIIIEE